MAANRSDSTGLIVGVVGPCCSGKSTLVEALLQRGFAVRHIAQEHSFTPSMWKVIGKADVLIYLDVSFEVAQLRRWMDWKPADLEEQGRRLRDAREHCDLYLQTDRLSAAEVLGRVLRLLEA
jgi:cytidylate kinase